MRTFLYIGAFFLFLFSGCTKDQLNDCFQSTGPERSETRVLESFSKIRIGEKFDIYLTQDMSQPEAITITGGGNIIGQIEARVKNGTLTVENRNTCNFVRSYKRKIRLDIRIRNLEDIEIFSASNLTSEDTLYLINQPDQAINIKNYGLGNINLKVHTGFLYIQSLNSGNTILEGFANILTCSIEEVTQMDARKLLADDVYIDLHSPLDCYINPRKKLYAKIFNSGNIYYMHVPDTDLKLVESRGSGGLYPF